MKVAGQSLNKESAIYGPLIFKRQVKNEETGELEPKEIVFWAKPVWDYDEFKKLCPKPENTHGSFQKGGFQKDDDHPEWKDQIRLWIDKRAWYQVIKTLEPSFKPLGDLEWEKVNLQDHKTWRHVDDELLELLPLQEFNLVLDLIAEANTLDKRKLEERAETFFARLAAKAAEAKAKAKKKKPSNSQSQEAENSTASSA